MGVYEAQCKKCTFCFIRSKKLSNRLKFKNLGQSNIASITRCDAIKVMAIGVLQEGKVFDGVTISHVKDAVIVMFFSLKFKDQK